MARKKRAYVTSYEIYTIDGEVAVDDVGSYETLEVDLVTALARAGVKQPIEIPRTNVTATATGALAITAITRRKRKRWWPTGTRRKSPCGVMSFDHWSSIAHIVAKARSLL